MQAFDEIYKKIKSGTIKVSIRGTFSPPIYRFWYQVDKNGPIHQVVGKCWQWTGGKLKGYGRIAVEGKVMLAHRLSWILHNGKVDQAIKVLHKCDNPSCVNPEHLFLGTDTDNMIDKVSKDRQAKGEENGTSKLTDNDVIQIRNRYTARCSYNGATALAKEYGVSRTVICGIVRRVSWKHI